MVEEHSYKFLIKTSILTFVLGNRNHVGTILGYHVINI